VASTFHRLWCG